LNSQTDYPKDWNYGIVAVPTGSTEDTKNNFVSMGYLSVNKNAAHKEEAIEYMAWRAQNE
jgi:ABC-type glycerol-3-phosphate transport system substrate-binding protein